MTDEPLSHIIRTPLPWRDEQLTECGRPTNDCGRVITVADARGAVKTLGKQRAAMMLCMTCANTCTRWATWDENPQARLAREVSQSTYHRGPRVAQINRELRAIALLIEEHRDEYDAAVAVLGEAVSIDDLRAARAEKRR